MKLDSPKWRPRLSKGNRLLGPYPEIIELGEENLPKLNSSHSHLIIQNDSRVRSIIINLPCNVVGLNYLVIAGLPALEQLRLVGQLGENWSNVLWMSIKNVPMLKRVCLAGDICSLEVDGAASLIELDMSACPRMDRVRIVSPRFDLNVNVNGCLKLRGIVGIDGQLAVSSGLAEQVSRNQDKSRRDLTLYQSMTFTDLDLVLDLVNDGVKAMSRAGQGWMSFQSRSILGYYDLMAYDPKFRPATYRILNPLEPVYTGGTGEVYAYASELLHVDADDLEIGRFEIGNHSPEECLEYILEGSGLAGYLLNGLRPGEDLPSADLRSTHERALKTLKVTVDSAAIGALHLPSVRVSASIEGSERQAFIDLASQVGMAVNDEEGLEYYYVYPASGVPSEELEIAGQATKSINLSRAMAQMARLRDSLAMWSGQEQSTRRAGF